MTTSELISRIERHLRPYLFRFPKLYSVGRETFMKKLVREKPTPTLTTTTQTLWGIEFQSPLFNAAGMFKDGNGYDMSYRQGAGAFLAGTVTNYPREGNPGLPFCPFPKSHAALNSLGLPNPGEDVVLDILKNTPRNLGCPVGVSIQHTANMGAFWKAEEAQVDFIEVNASCPNVKDHMSIKDSLDFINYWYIKRRKRNIPMIAKFSNDQKTSEDLVDLCLKLGFSGINFGNTSTQYEDAPIHPQERATFDRFVSNYGGGISGRPTRKNSLRLIESAREYLEQIKPDREFHLIQCGGIETAQDLKESLEVGASLCQWFTGYFESFGKHGHMLYRKLQEEL